MNVRPTFRNPDKFQVLPFREWIRNNMPSGRDGFVAEDLDLVVRLYGPRFHTDATGKFMLIELKHGNTQPAIAQQKTFGLIDALLRKADPEQKRYLGYFVVNYDNEDWNVSTFRINGKPVTLYELKSFLQDEPIKEREQQAREIDDITDWLGGVA